MFILVLPIAALFTLCNTARQYHDYYYQPFNSTRSTPFGIAAYRSALTLDWMSAEDHRQRELVSAFEQDPQFPSPVAKLDCISYNRPSASNVAKLMLEVLKNLEGDDGVLVANLVQALVRAKLLMLETTMFDNEPDFDALVKTPMAMIGEPHTTFPRIVEVLWLAITDPSTVKKYGWCTVSKMTAFIQASRPVDIAKHMRASEQIVSRARFIMEEFIQHVTPLNMEKPSVSTSTTMKFEPLLRKSQSSYRHQNPPLKPSRPIKTPPANGDLAMERNIRTQPGIEMRGSAEKNPSKPTTSSTTEDLSSILETYTDDTKETKEENLKEDIPGGKRRNEDPFMNPSSKSLHKAANWLLVLMLCFS